MATSDADRDAAQQTGDEVGLRTSGQITAPPSSPVAQTASNRFSLLHRLSITSMLTMLAAAAILILLYRQDQLDEHRSIAQQDNENSAVHLIQMLNGQIVGLIASSEAQNPDEILQNPRIASFSAALHMVREHDILKLEIYNKKGLVVFSTVGDDIGTLSENTELQGKALADGIQHSIEFRKAFPLQDEVLHSRHLLATYIPLKDATQHSIGVLEIYKDITPALDRVNSKIIQIALVIFGIFAALHTALFFSARKADRTLAEDSRKQALSEARLRMTVDSALDGIITIDEESRLIGFNPAAETIFGWQSSELMGKSMTDLLIPERYREPHEKGLKRYLETGEARIVGARIEISALRRDGSEFPIELTVAPIREGDRTLFTAFIRDISTRKQAEQELRESRAFHESVTEAMGEIGIGLFIVDADFRVRYMNNVMKRWFGDQTGETCYSSLCDINKQCEHCQIEHVILKNGTAHYTPTTPDGRTFDIIATPIQNRDGTISKLEVIRDVTGLRETEQELRIAAKAFESLEGMYITDANGIIQRVNKAFVDTTGYSPEEAVGKTAVILRSGRHDSEFYRAIREALEHDGHWQGEVWNRRKNGEIYPEWQTISAVRDADGQVSHFVSVFTDISLRKKTEEQIRTLAFYDPLTQLPNRRLLLDRLQQALALNARTGRQGALMFIDLDNFKTINDTQGHAVGDQLLVEAANRLQGCIRGGDTTARLGGDEFVVLVEDMDTDEQAAAAQIEIVGEKIRTTLGKPYFIGEHEHHSSASIGVTLFGGSAKTIGEMLKRADVALYQAKADGRNTLRFFDPEMQAAVTARAALEADLRRAISEQEQFTLYYQPQVDTAGRLTGAEALVRWQHPVRGMVSPAEFIPLAEESGLILPLGHWVLTAACMQLANWASQPSTAHLTLAVNVSTRQFHLPTFVEEVLTLVDYFQINPARLKLEITESLMMENVDDIIAKMSVLQAKGISFSMDDFGTGYSSLTYLKRLPLSQLKIDQSFVRDVLTDPNDAAIARIIISLAQSMNLAVIAEGVETEMQREFLKLSGCHAFQGYLYSKPVPVQEFEQLVAKYN